MRQDPTEERLQLPASILLNLNAAVEIAFFFSCIEIVG
jgi:hypothetical protein